MAMFVRFLHYVPHWLIAIAILVAAGAIALLLFQIVRTVARRLLRSHHHPVLEELLRRAGPLFRFALVLFASVLAAPELPLGENATETLHRVFIAAFILLLGSIAIFASNIAAAGIAGIALGFAAKPVLGNLIAGIQLAITQPIRIDDVVIIGTEFGWVEEFTSTYVVVRLWDWRRMIVPLSYFLENPFQNWTRTSSTLIGSVYFHLDHRTPIAALREKLDEIVKASKLWDGKVVNLQVTDTTEYAIEVRALATARDSSKVWDLRCEIREKMLSFLQSEYPESLPRRRNETVQETAPARPVQPHEAPVRALDRAARGESGTSTAR